MAGNSAQARSRLISQVLQGVRKRLSAAKSKNAEGFVRQFFANVPPSDLRGETAANLAGGALALWDRLQTRVPRKASVRGYNPDLKADGWETAHSVIEIINDDMPFLVDSVTAEINRHDAEVHLVIHPIMTLRRNEQGKLLKLIEAKASTVPGAVAPTRESVMQIQISEQPADRLAKITAGVKAVLSDVRASVEDWPTMRERCAEVIAELETSPPMLPVGEISEGLEFLKWMNDDHFTFLGYRDFSFHGRGGNAVTKIKKHSGLGVLRSNDVRVFDGLRDLGKLPPEVRDFVRKPQLLRVTKGNRRSTVHRSVHLDTVAVKTFDKKGDVTGERLFVGLFTSIAYSRSPSSIPLLRQKIDAAMKLSGFEERSHDGKALTHILETYPRDELFQIPVEELSQIATGVLHLQERQRTALFVRRDPFERFVSCMVYVPRDRYDTSLRRKLQDILSDAYDGHCAAFSTQMSDEVLARLHLIIKTKPGKIPPVNMTKLEQDLVQASRSWSDLLEEALVAELGEQRGLRRRVRYERAFPPSYQRHFDSTTAVFDIERIEEALNSNDLAMNLYRPDDGPEELLHFKIYILDNPVPLSDILPMLENMGLRVIGEIPFDIEIPDRREPIWMHDFDMIAEGAAAIDLDAVRDAFHDAFARVWHGEMENDGFNKLVLHAGLTAREVIILRAYCKYLRQARIPFSQAYMEATLVRNPKLTRLLVDLFLARFEPSNAKSAERQSKKIVTRIQGLLDQVSNLDEDRIIRRYLNLILSTLRTNFFQPAAGGGEKIYCSFKFDSRAIEELPQPQPLREIFVYSPAVEGVHLRFGMVARGGLRWSDRQEDFRTEVLGLVKAQQVKNTVIVPVGSKGGFVMKQPPPPDAGRDAFLAAGIECYKTFIRGLLDITDNLKSNRVIPPKQVTRYDGDDPYLVVAADKGTATFSDIANGVSADYGFWLDDAFASGGSAGYDHKKMGITARGGWESVKRHFRELGKDIQNEDFTCVGCGDMSGDVFGNGMLLSKHIKLVGAFNHMHIFVDPDPDAARSWQERKRLFDLPRSGWADYNEELISKGGGIFERSAKSIAVSAAMKKLFAVSKDSVTPNELIKAMLLADMELLWFGGIGTYVKAASESDLDVGDRANDAIRINGSRVGAKVIGEGANLGVTQLGRIEYGMAGGRSNTDFIDNSAGVDCSDHEVNIKILLGGVEAAGSMTRKQRDRLLEKMTDEVGEQCLRDNYLQSQAITVTHELGGHLLDRFARFMRALEKDGLLDRDIEFLPDDEAVLERMKRGEGLTRPEVAVLLSYSKLVLYDELLGSNLPDDPYFADDLTDYFPKPLRAPYAEEIARHRLQREIVVTVVSNDLVNRVGINFVHEVREKTGMAPQDVVRAYLVTREIFGMRKLWEQIEALDNKVPALLQSRMLVETGRLIERETVWFLREVGPSLDIATEIANYGAGVATLVERIESLLSPTDRTYLAERSRQLVEQGAPKALAQRIASLSFLAPVCDIVRIASSLKRPVEKVAEAYFTIGDRFGFDWLRRSAGGLPTDTAWDKLAVTAIIDDFYGHQSELTTRVLGANGKAAATEKVIASWSAKRAPLVNRTEQLLEELKASAAPDFAMLAVANRQLKSMVSG
ncbi:NAD-glutamate dehydrogenase [Pelagibius litoralis]|uniref:NAD-glutamate dehydrogenase n=1 Tax=Pelagibius litoralis TaxID=374515 RepID=A0A967F121_9PROT|nr:NAD-glutamate dehydrogenase [Pelagibius litoralis]NIA71020.1 NAD-glutamate dehydrogenase [Pelagibius litoralis]